MQKKIILIIYIFFLEKNVQNPLKKCQEIVYFQPNTKVLSVGLSTQGTTYVVAQIVQLSGEAPFVIFEWLV